MTGIKKNRRCYFINFKEFVVPDVKVFFKRILFHWPFLLVIVAIGIVAGIFYADLEKPKFKSHLTFILNENDEDVNGNLLNIASHFGLSSVNSGKSIFTSNNIVELIKSRRILEDALLSTDTFNNRPYRLIEYYLEISNYRSKSIKDIHYPVGLLKNNFTYRQDSLLYEVYLKFKKEYVKVKNPNKSLDVYEASVTSPDEKFTKLFTERIVADTYEYYVKIRTSKTKGVLDVFEERVAVIKTNLDNAIDAEGIGHDVNINTARSTAIVSLIQKQVNAKIYQAAYIAMYSNMQIARLSFLKKTSLMQIINGAEYPMEKIYLRKRDAIILFPFFSVFLSIFFLWIWRILALSKTESVRMYHENFKDSKYSR